MTERDDWGYRLAGWWCWIFWHKWEVWTPTGSARCARCLRWKDGKGPTLMGLPIVENPDLDAGGDIVLGDLGQDWTDMWWDLSAPGWSRVDQVLEVPGWVTVWYESDRPEYNGLYGVRARSERSYGGLGARVILTLVSCELATEEVAAIAYLAMSWDAEAEANQ